MIQVNLKEIPVTKTRFVDLPANCLFGPANGDPTRWIKDGYESAVLVKTIDGDPAFRVIDSSLHKGFYTVIAHDIKIDIHCC